MSARYYLIVAAAAILATGCSGDEKKDVVAKVAEGKPVPMEPFRFHKAIEVSPGQTYDVVSWGRGSTDAGAFAILHSDSSAIQYTTTTGDLDGTIADAFNADMDTDGNPEILIQAKTTDTMSYAKLYAFEFNNGGANKLDFPKLTRSQRNGYRGGDNFFIRDGKLIREFPIYDRNDSLAKPTTAKRQLEYGLRNNDFTVTQLSKDSVSANTAPVTKAEPEKKRTISKTDSKKRSESRRRRRRRN